MFIVIGIKLLKKLFLCLSDYLNHQEYLVLSFSNDLLMVTEYLAVFLLLFR